MAWETIEVDDCLFDVHVGTKQSVLVLGQSEILLKTKDLKEQLKIVAKVYNAIFQLGVNDGKNDLRYQLKELLGVRD